MKLRKLYIGKYKNLQDFDLDFESGKGLTILIGNNGSGKSNILEAISAIFANAYAGKPLYQFVYSLTYEIKGKVVKLSRTIYRCQYYIKEINQDDLEFKVVSLSNLARNGYLPTNVIALYSGEDKRWWHEYYEPFHHKYIQKLSDGGTYTPKLPMYYINKYYWNIALLTLIFSRAGDDKEFLKEKIGIETVDHILLFYSKMVTRECSKPLLKAFLDTVNRLSSHGTTENGDPIFLYGMGDRDILDTYGIKALKHYASFRKFYMFADAKFLQNPPEEEFSYIEKEVFDFFVQAYMPQQERIIKGIEIICDGYSSRHLSEGEKKLILIRAALSFVADENSLVLFDEPDANVHESRKLDLYQLFSEFAEVQRQMIVVTHSPTFVDVAKMENLKFLRRMENGCAELIDEDKVEAIRNLTGSRNNAFLQKPILFCEGTETSIENKLYPILFPGYQIIAAGGHEEVINHTKAYNRTFGDDTHWAIGIIDWDYKTESQLTALREERIYSLKVVEIENVLMDLTLIRAAKEYFYADEDSEDNVKKYLFSDCKKSKQKQAVKYTSNRIVSKIKASLTTKGRDIEQFKANIAGVLAENEIDTLYSERLDQLDQYINNCQFEELVSIYDFNHNVDRFLNDITNHYQDRILRLIQDRSDLQDFLRQKYYSDIVE